MRLAICKQFNEIQLSISKLQRWEILPVDKLLNQDKLLEVGETRQTAWFLLLTQNWFTTNEICFSLHAECPIYNSIKHTNLD